MTDPQEKKYFRRWGAVSRALNWKMIKGRLHTDAVGRESSRAGSSVASPHHAAVWQAAAALAVQHHRGVTADDLRHGIHVVAIGRDKSHTDFSNREFDQVLNYVGDERGIRGLLLDPFDLAGDIHQANGDLKSRERHLRFLLDKCVVGYVVSECERIYGTKDFEALSTEHLIALSDHLRNRPHALRTFSQGNDRQGNEDEPPDACVPSVPSVLSADGVEDEDTVPF